LVKRVIRLKKDTVLKNKNQRDTEGKVDKWVMKNEKAYLKKLMYNEFDEAETYIKGKVKTTKVNKPKKKETKPVRGKKNLSDDWE
jgi:hypothetical protein